MPNYAVFLHGQNYPLKIEGKSDLFGFFVTRQFVTNTENEAKTLAVRSLKNDPDLYFVDINGNEAETSVEIMVIHELPDSNKMENTKFTFYSMDE